MEAEAGYADMRKNRFLFSQESVNLFVIEAMVEGLMGGHKFPEILVQKVCGDSYGVWNGNHRVMAYGSLGMNPLIKESDTSRSLHYKLNISPVVLSKKLTTSRVIKLKGSLSFLPYNVVIRFCSERGLDSKYFLSQ